MHTTHTQHTFLKKAKRPLLVLSLLLLGGGVASAYDTCACTQSAPAPVYRPAPAPVVYRSAPVVYRSAPVVRTRTVYRPVTVYEPLYYRVVDPCNPCVTYVSCDPCGY